MKHLIYILLAASVSLSSCRKENCTGAAPVSSATSITEADFEDSRAVAVVQAKKNTSYGMDIDYDLVIKEVSDDKYKVALRLKALVVNTRRIANQPNNHFRNAIFGAVLTINTTKKESEIPLDVKLTSTGINGDIFEFPEFTFKGDLTYELVKVNTSFLVKDGELKIKDKTTFTLAGSDFTVEGGNFNMNDVSNFSVKENTTITVNAEKTETNFAILLTGGKGMCSDDDDYFILPKGNTQEQNPEVAKIIFPKNEDGSFTSAVITIVGDPAGTVKGALYTPAPIPDPNNPGSTIQPPAMKFVPKVESNRKSIVRVYGPATGNIDGQPGFKKSDFNKNGPGWARITILYTLE